MKVAGFTIARNVVKYDYPILASIQSVLPLCDHFYIGVGKSDDNTLEVLRAIGSPKIVIFETEWDESLFKGGKILAFETNRVIDLIPREFDWLFYIQADEVVHENDHEEIKSQMQLHASNANVDGLLFKYRHFYGSYDYLADSRAWYKREVRIIKNNPAIRSFRDAQGFRKNGEEKVNAIAINAYINHYGWVKHPTKMLEKIQGLASNWTHSKSIGEIADSGSFDYSKIDSLAKYIGTHPKYIQERIKSQNWKFDTDISKKNFKSLRYRLLMFIESLTGYRIGEYRNFKIVKS